MKKFPLQSLYLWAKKVHRWCMWVTLLFILIMASTGLVLKYPSIGILFDLNFSLIRYIHREVSTWFTITLLVMMGSGLLMYFIPELIKKQNSTNK